MSLHRLLSPILLGALLVATPLAASADPSPVAAEITPAATTQAQPAEDDAAMYAEREAQSPEAAKFEGGRGRGGIYIGTTALLVVVIVLLVIIIL